MKPLMTLETVLTLLHQEVERAGGISAFARMNGIGHPDVSNSLARRRLPTKDILDALKVRKVPAYERL